MLTLKLFALMTAAVLAAACGATADGPPEIQIDRTACSHCGMLISEPVYAAAYRLPGAEARAFDDIGCLLEAARAETADGLRFWFHDAQHGGWIDGTAAVFVASPEIRTPMGGGYLAYGDVAAAEEAARKHRGEMVRSLAELLTRPGPTSQPGARRGGTS